MPSDYRPSVDYAPPAFPAVRIVNLLPTGVVRQVHAATCARQAWFHASGSAYDAGPQGLGSRSDPGHRTSLVLDDAPEVLGWFLPLVRALLPMACRYLMLPPFFAAETEAQITAHGTGDFFGAHSDNGTYRLHRRTVSYVYYFGEEHPRFVGGELLFSDGATVPPAWNSIVFFPSGTLHEVRSVRAPAEFSASRFTINGWMSR